MSSAPSTRRSAGSTATRTRPARTGTATANSKTNQKQRINLAGSTAVISDYFHYAINCILYQRAIYDQADFKMVKKFGLQMMVVEDEMIADYLKKIVDQVRVWLVEGKISRLVLVIQRKDNGETIERWEFDVHVEDPSVDESESNTAQISAQSQPSSSSAADRQPRTKSKTLAEVQSEIQVIIRQIIATVSFLPIPDAPRTFKVLAHTHSVGQDEATQWNDSEAFDITQGAERVKLKSFSTALHRVDTAVDYKLRDFFSPLTYFLLLSLILLFFVLGFCSDETLNRYRNRTVDWEIPSSRLRAKLGVDAFIQFHRDLSSTFQEAVV